MRINADDQVDSGGLFSSNLFRLEKIAAFAILGGNLIYHALRSLGLGPELNGIYALPPLLLLFSGATLLLAGAGSQKYPGFSALLHIPLVIWLVIFALALS